MLKKALSILIIICSTYSYSQMNDDFGLSNSHEYYVDQLEDSKDQTFQEIIELYNNYIENNPKKVITQIELCKFIGSSYIDEYDEYNMKYDETEECIANLLKLYPKNPKVLIYRAENIYGEERYKVLNDAVKLIENEKQYWSNKEIAVINEMLGSYHVEEDYLSLIYYKKAQKLDDDLDLSLPLAKIYLNQGKDELAKKTLFHSLEKDTTVWKLNQKADLLLKLKEPEKALELYDVIALKDSIYINNSEMADAMTKLNNFKEARIFLIRDTVQEWNKIEKIQKLLDHDMSYSDPEVALLTYRRLQRLNSYNDFLGVKRLSIFVNKPLLNWKATELFHVLLVVMSLMVLLIIPYLWVLPVYSLGVFLKSKNKKTVSKLNSKWNIKHFWMISFLYVLINYLVVLIYYYQEYINYYFEIVTSYEEVVESTMEIANSTIFFTIGMAVSTILMLNKRVVKYVFYSNLSVLRMISLGVGFVIFNMVLLKFMGLFIDLNEASVTSVFLSAKVEINALLKSYGFGIAFLLIAVIVPVYEEIIFRGVILGVVEKKLGFVFANIFQALLFALIHYDLKLFIFYFIFGLITGNFVNKTKGLLAGIIFHGINNLFVLFLLYQLSKFT